MIHLNNAPIFLEFLANNLKISKATIANNFYISGKCNCNQSDCATVILKKRKNSSIDKNKLELDIQIENIKGVFNFHWFDDEYIEIEAILYKHPFKNEINKLFPKSGILSKITPTKVKLKKMKENDKLNLKRYCNKKMSLYEKKMFYQLDYKACSGKKLFAHIR